MKSKQSCQPDKTLHPEVANFAEKLTELVELLSKHGTEPWVYQISKALTEVRASDGHGVLRIIRMYGGMGSLNDLILDGPDQDNNTLYRLRHEIYVLAEALAADL